MSLSRQHQTSKEGSQRQRACTLLLSINTKSSLTPSLLIKTGLSEENRLLNNRDAATDSQESANLYHGNDNANNIKIKRYFDYTL